MKNSFFLIIVLLFWVSAELQAKNTYVDGMTNEEFVERFSDLAFGKNRLEGDNLNKFMRPIRIIFFGSNKALIDEYRHKFELTLKMLREDIGIDISIESDGRKANYAVLISDTPVFDMLVKIKNTVKLFKSNDTEDFHNEIKDFERNKINVLNGHLSLPSNELVGCLHIQRVQTHKNLTKSEDVAKRIENALLHCLGFKRHYFEDDQFSSLASKHNQTDYSLTGVSYSGFDIAAMKMLYHNNIHAGMSYEEAKKTITQIIELEK